MHASSLIQPDKAFKTNPLHHITIAKTYLNYMSCVYTYTVNKTVKAEKKV